MFKYSKNFILCGEVDYHCLLCAENFQDIKDVDKHLRWQQHRTTVKYQDYFPKFRNDCIYKIEHKYYCEVCNYLTLDIELLRAHLRTEEHKTNKRNPEEVAFKKSIPKRNDNYVVIGHVTLNKRQWNGILKDDCILCETPLGNFEKHINSQSHLINLIQTKTFCERGDRYYRKINDDTFYCIVCRYSYPMIHFPDHWEEPRHLDNVISHMPQPSEAPPPVDPNLARMEEIENKLIEAQKAYYYVNFEKKTAKCKKCKFPVDFTFRAMVDHYKEHDINNIKKRPHLTLPVHDSSDEEEVVQYTELVDHGKRRAELANYAKEHFINLNSGGSKGHCTLCNTFLSGSLKLFKEHIRGTRHHCFLELKGLKTVTPYTKPLYDVSAFPIYMKNTHHIPSHDVFWVNRNLSINTRSFNLLYPLTKNPYKNRMICYACDIIIPLAEEKEHLALDEHKKAIVAALLVTSIKEEFIREIRPNVYHCGYCNNLYPRWDILDKHLKGWQHAIVKKEKHLDASVATSIYSSEINLRDPGYTNPEILYSQLLDFSINP